MERDHQGRGCSGQGHDQGQGHGRFQATASSFTHMEVERKDSQWHMQQSRIILFHIFKGHKGMEKILQYH